MSDFRILTVCTGNIARSAAAERLLASSLTPQLRFAVESAGTQAMVGASIDGAIVGMLRDRGARWDSHSARQVTRGMLREAELILTATRAHRSALVELEPRSLDKSFTLTEFAALATEATSRHGLTSSEPPERAAELAAWASHNRGLMMQLPARLTEDIADPYGRSRAVYRRSFDRIAAAADVISATILDTQA